MFKGIRKVNRQINRIKRVNRKFNKITKVNGKINSSRSFNRNITRISNPGRNKGCLMGFIEIIGLFSALSSTRISQTNIEHVPIDNLTGHQFEIYLANLFKGLGYKVETTGKGADFGADLVATINGDRRIIQAKRYSSTVGITAVQEVLGAKRIYKGTSTAVITTNYFTPAAKR